MNRTILTVFGTRPEAIKMAPVVLSLQRKSGLTCRNCVTGQHDELLSGILDVFGVVPDINLRVMKKGQDLYDLTGRILIEMREVLKEIRPSVVLVHGDTTTTFATTLAAYYQKIPVGHVEAGLRTGDIYSPWPEEGNRNVVSRLAAYHFAPTADNRKNLIAEGVCARDIFVTGNTVVDALHYVLAQFDRESIRIDQVRSYISAAGYVPTSRRMILITGHRRENFGDGFIRVFSAIKCLAERFPNVDFVYPVHMNPEVLGPARNLLSGIDNIFLIPPLPYEPFVYMMKHSHFIITDSGGIQEEAPTLGKPVLVTRIHTERPEGLESGTVKLVGTDFDSIVKVASSLLEDSKIYESMATAHNPYGMGLASDTIANVLWKALQPA